jgi:hydrophobic/amphiphilic exporter-1 (mainly G- bacteria), HAE1 family
MSKFFSNRPIVAMVISIVLVMVGSLTMLNLPVAQFPKYYSAGNPDPGHLRWG